MADDERIPTNLRTLLILETLGAAGRAMNPSEIGKQIGLPKQTVHRLCATLVEEGFLIREINEKKLRPARRSRILAAGVLYASQSHITRHQILVEISRQIGETVNFVIPEENGMHYLDRVETDWPFRVQLPVGTNVPYHCTASGKTYLASMPPAERRRLVATLDLEQLTPNTFCEVDKLLAELHTISKKGYAVDNEEFFEGMVAIAVPVKDLQGRYCASVAFHGPAQRLSIPDLTSRKDVLIDGSKKLTEALFS